MRIRDSGSTHHNFYHMSQCQAKLRTSIKKRIYLPLKKIVEVIKTFEKNNGMTHRSLAEQIAHILQNKESIMTLYQSNASGSKIHSSKMCHVSEFEDVNTSLYKWYVLACSKNIYPGGGIAHGKG